MKEESRQIRTLDRVKEEMRDIRVDLIGHYIFMYGKRADGNCMADLFETDRIDFDSDEAQKYMETVMTAEHEEMQLTELQQEYQSLVLARFSHMRKN